jgi:hypothetical protein
MADWNRRFDDPIPLGDGRKLLTLRDAGRYIQSLPAAEQRKVQWQTATSILLAAAEGRDFPMHARIAVAKAIALPKAPVEKRRRAAKKYRVIR